MTNTKIENAAFAAVEDHHAAQEALMEVNRRLTAAATACRALVHDAGSIKDPELRKSARRLLRLVQGMKDGPNKAVWAELHTIQIGARNVARNGTRYV